MEWRIKKSTGFVKRLRSMEYRGEGINGINWNYEWIEKMNELK